MPRLWMVDVSFCVYCNQRLFFCLPHATVISIELTAFFFENSQIITTMRSMVHGMHRIPVHCDVHLCLCTLSYLLDAQECLIYYANVHLNAMPCHADVVDLAQGAPAKCHSRHPIRPGSPERCTRRRNFADFIMTILSLISDRIKNVYTLYIVIKFILRWAKQIHWIREGPINDDFVLLRCRKKKYK